jgi:hypothetical protein
LLFVSAEQLIYLLGFSRFSEEIILFLERNAKKKCFKSSKMNFFHLVFCGNIALKPSWYIMENLSDSKKNDVLPEFQTFLLEKKLTPEKNVFFYALWVSK